MILTIWSNFWNGCLSMQAFSTLINGFCWGNPSCSATSLNEAIARAAVLPCVLLGGICMRIIGSRCQWPITSALVSSRHWRVKILEMTWGCVRASLHLWATTQRCHSRKIYIFGSSTIFSVSLVKVVLVCLEHHFVMLFFWNFW